MVHRIEPVAAFVKTAPLEDGYSEFAVMNSESEVFPVQSADKMSEVITFFAVCLKRGNLPSVDPLIHYKTLC